MNSRFTRSLLRKTGVLQSAAAALGALAFLSLAQAAEVPLLDQPAAGPAREMGSVVHVVITLNKSTMVRVQRPFQKVIVAAADVADVLPATAHTLYIQGKKIGTTNVSVFDEAGRLIKILDIEVTLETGSIAEQIHASLGNSGIQVSASGGRLILTGLAPDAVAADRAVAMAKGFAGDAAVVNAMQVAPAQQVMLEVRFLEVSRTAARQLGVNWFGAGPGGIRGVNTGLPGGSVSPIVPPVPVAGTGGVPIFRTTGTLGAIAGQPSLPFATILSNILTSGNGTLDVLVTALEQKGLARRLAEPNLIALSGDAARFLAGGEFPVPVATATAAGVPTVTIEWKKFGVQLGFLPTVLSRGVINLRIEPSVSELDFTNAITIAGTTVPSVITRDARTTVELRDGQSFAIAGLLQTRSRRDVSQVPWIGSVPVIGALFRSPSYVQDETDLVVIVTPRLVAPAAPGQRLASPLDARIPSNDVDFFLNGQPEVRKRYNDYVSAGGDLKGPYGHMIVPEFGVRNSVVKASNVVLQTRN